MEKQIVKANSNKNTKIVTNNNNNDHSMNNSNNTKTINNGNVNNVVNNINLVGYGFEDISRLDKGDILSALQNGYNSTIRLTEAVHFNPKYPEYHNVYISNIRDKYGMLYDGKDWNLRVKEELINMIYDDKKSYIEENLEEFLASLSVSRRRALDRWLATDDDDAKISKIKEEIKLLLYNKRNIVLETHKIDKTNNTKQTKNKKITKTSTTRSIKDGSR
jgi:GTP-binding protein EngB required for normal cell division